MVVLPAVYRACDEYRLADELPRRMRIGLCNVEHGAGIFRFSGPLAVRPDEIISSARIEVVHIQRNIINTIGQVTPIHPLNTNGFFPRVRVNDASAFFQLHHMALWAPFYAAHCKQDVQFPADLMELRRPESLNESSFFVLIQNEVFFSTGEQAFHRVRFPHIQPNVIHVIVRGEEIIFAVPVKDIRVRIPLGKRERIFRLYDGSRHFIASGTFKVDLVAFPANLFLQGRTVVIKRGRSDCFQLFPGRNSHFFRNTNLRVLQGRPF